jgi:hypothetical protein
VERQTHESNPVVMGAEFMMRGKRQRFSENFASESHAATKIAETDEIVKESRLGMSLGIKRLCNHIVSGIDHESVGNDKVAGFEVLHTQRDLLRLPNVVLVGQKYIIAFGVRKGIFEIWCVAVFARIGKDFNQGRIQFANNAERVVGRTVVGDNYFVIGR